MRFSSYINNQRCIEWGLNVNQGALFDLLNQASSWAKEIIVDGVVYYWVSRNKVLEELPLFYKKADTVYRHFCDLESKGLIIYLKQGKHGDKDLIRLTEKGKTWNEFNSDLNPNNSEIDPNIPTELGNKSEITRIEIRNNSEIDPTNNNTNYKYTTDHNNTSQQVATSPKRKNFSDDDLKTAYWIFNLILKINPEARSPNFDTWADEVRLIRERDKRSHREICELFQFANQDDFWCKNILSPKNLRKHWDRLVIERGKPKKKSWAEMNNSDWNNAAAWEEML